MRALIPWRSRAAVWLTVPALIGVVAYSLRYASQTTVIGYWPAATSAAAIYLLFSCSLASCSAAWEGRRYREGRLAETSATRSAGAIVLGLLWPAFAAGCLVQAFAVLLISRYSFGAPGGPSVLVLVTYAAIVFFHTCCGFLIGRWLPPVVALPLAPVLSYCWLGFAWAVSVFPPRYLAGLVLSNCCTVETELDERAPTTALVFNLVAGAGALLLTMWRPRDGVAIRRVALPLGAAMSVVAVLLGITLASGLGATPLRPRPTAEARCTGTAPVICLYPEQTRLRDPMPTIRTAARNLEAAGVDLPATIRSGPQASTPSTVTMIVQVDMSHADLVHSLAAALLPQTIASYCGTLRDYDARMDAASIAAQWLVDTAAHGIVPSDTVEPVVQSADASSVRELERLPRAEQARWVTETIRHLTDCSTDTRPVPHP